MATGSSTDLARRLAGPAAIAATFAVYLAWTWGKWPDPLIDFGRELYVAWRLSEGERLYADLAYFNGPLSPTWNGLLFRLFGTGLRTLAIGNALVLAAIAAAAYATLRILGDRVVATAGTLALFVCFAFAQFLPGGNYTYLAPYSHEATHGTLLGAVALLLLAAHLRSGSRRSALAAGAALGLAFLTKAEFTIALLPALALGIALGVRARQGSRGPAPAAVAAAFGAGALLPPAVAFVALLGGLPAAGALRGVLGSWVYLFDGRLHDLPFYREIRGTLDVGASLGTIAGWIARYALALAPAAAAARWAPRGRAGRLATAAAFALSVAIVLIGEEDRPWGELATPWPLFLAAALVVVARPLLRRPGGENGMRRILATCALVYALGLLAKMPLNTRILHYGFVLAMPAGLAVVAIALGGIPAWLDRRGRNGSAFRVAVLGLLLAFAYVQASATGRWLARRTVEVGSGADRFLAHARDAAVPDLVATVARLRGPGETLLVVPEGVMINYLLRTPNPTGHVNFMPPELLMFGEDRIADAFEAGRPDWVVLLNRGAGEYGFRMFGDDYGRRPFAWIEANYRVAARVQETTPAGPAPFAAVLRRVPPGTPAATP